MERRGEIQAQIGKKIYFNEAQIEVNYAEDPFAEASDVAWHEAEHVVAGIDDGAYLELVSVKPGPGYLGITRFNRYTPAGAAAPHANGRRGTSHDLNVIRMHGDSETSAGIRGLNSIRNKPKHVRKIAQKLDRDGTLYGNDVNIIYKEIDLGEEIIINITLFHTIYSIIFLMQKL